MYLEIEFEEQDNSFDLEFEQVTEISDGGFDRGYAEGYENGKGDGLTEGYAKGETEGFADALAKRTELVVTDSGEYVPEGESTGFKKVTVGIQKGEDLDAVVAEQAELIGELSATLDEKIGAYDVGYDAALEKLTDLVATENGDYKPSEGSTGFKSVSVNVQAKSAMDALIEGTLTELTSGATIMAKEALYYNKYLESVSLPNATEIGLSAFQYCAKLVTVNAPNVTKVYDSAFSYCNLLKNVNLPNATTFSSYVFYNCNTLENIQLPKLRYIDQYNFSGCYRLVSVDATTATAIYHRAFRYCYSLKAVILRSETVCTLSDTNAFENCYHILGTVNSTYNPNGDKDGYIYVPAHLAEQYRQATNWSAYASQIRALEDYTVDGTINGALDPNKI